MKPSSDIPFVFFGLFTLVFPVDGFNFFKGDAYGCVLGVDDHSPVLNDADGAWHTISIHEDDVVRLFCFCWEVVVGLVACKLTQRNAIPWRDMNVGYCNWSHAMRNKGQTGS